MANTISVSVVGDVRDINKKLGNVEQQLGGFGKSASKAASMLKAAFAGVAVVSFFKDVVGAASDAQQSLGATETVFGKFADSVVKTSETAATKYGISANTYRENANLIGSLFKNQGVAADKLAGQTDKLIGVGADLAATFGGTTTDAVEALGAAFKGEFDPLERYGISLKQSTVTAKAGELAHQQYGKALDKLSTSQQKALQQQATQALITQQSAASLGAFGKESDTLAHQQQVLGAKFDDVKVKLGTFFLPILTRVFSFLADTALPAAEKFGRTIAEKFSPAIQKAGQFLAPVVKAVQVFFQALTGNSELNEFDGALQKVNNAGINLADFFTNKVVPALQAFGAFLTGTVVPAIQSLVGWLIQNQAWLTPIAVGIGAIVLAWKAYQTYLTIAAAVTKAYTAVQAALNVVMSLNPIGIVVLAIIGLVAALVYAWKTSATFRNIVIGAWNAVKSATSSVWNFIKGVVSGVFSAFMFYIKNFTLPGLIISHWNTIKSKTTEVWDSIKNAVSKAISGAVDFVKGLKGKILGALAGAGTWLIETGKNLLQGMVKGLQSMARNLVDAAVKPVEDAISAVKNKLKIGSPSRLFKQIGQWTSEGLAIGLKDTAGVRVAAKGLASAVADGFSAPELSLSGDGGAGVSAARTYNVTVNVPPTADQASIGRQIVSAIQEHERVNGARWRS